MTWLICYVLKSRQCNRRLKLGGVDEFGVIDLIERAEKAGWSGMEAAVAVGIIARALVRDQITGVIDNEQT
jgi:hypothetical protein